jgi:Flp pilus assembly protein TadB
MACEEPGDRVSAAASIMLASAFGLACDYVLLAFAPNLWWLVVVISTIPR